MTTFSMIIPILLGMTICLLSYRPWPQKGLYQILLLVCLSVGVGYGISSCLFFLWFILGGQSINTFIIVEVSLLVLLAAITIAKTKVSLKNYDFLQGITLQMRPLQIVLLAIFVVMLANYVLFYVIAASAYPWGQADGVGIWNLKARFLFRAGEHWRDTFNDRMWWICHPDYPLLLPLAVARGWKYVGGETSVVNSGIHIIYSLSILGLLLSSLAILRSPSQGFLGAIVLMSSLQFINFTTSHFADIPLAYYFLATFLLFWLYEKSPVKNNALLFLAGLTAGLAAWTKNEGILFIIATIMAMLLIIRGEETRASRRDLAYFATGCSIILILVIYFKAALAPPNDIISKMDTRLLFSLSRYWVTLKIFALNFINFEPIVTRLPFFNYLSITLLLLCYLILIGSLNIKHNKSLLLGGLIVFSVMFSGYYIIYLLSPHNLTWHLNMSFNRLMYQLWPTFIFAFFIVVRTPEEVLANIR